VLKTGHFSVGCELHVSIKFPHYCIARGVLTDGMAMSNMQLTLYTLSSARSI